MTNDEQICHLSFGCHVADNDMAPGISVRVCDSALVYSCEYKCLVIKFYRIVPIEL